MTTTPEDADPFTAEPEPEPPFITDAEWLEELRALRDLTLRVEPRP